MKLTEKTIRKMIEFERNRQLTRFSTYTTKGYTTVLKSMKNKFAVIICGDQEAPLMKY